jgi:hypothetical protein
VVDKIGGMVLVYGIRILLVEDLLHGLAHHGFVLFCSQDLPLFGMARK